MRRIRSVIPSLLPKSRLEWALYFFIFLCALRPWSLGWILFPHDPAAVRVIYRAPEGDTEYFPLINAVAKGNFGESAIYEVKGTGIVPFPLGSVIYHALAVALFGYLPGYILADIFIVFLFFFLFRFWCRLFSDNDPWTTFLAALFVTGLPQILNGFGLGILNIGTLWMDRIPRSFVTDNYLIAGLGLLAAMTWKPEIRNRLTAWILLGAVLSLGLQSIIYVLPALGIGAAFVGLQWLREDRSNWRLICGRVICSILTFLVLSAPFFYQRAMSSPGADQRLGLTSVNPWFVCFHTSWYWDASAYTGLFILALLAWSNAWAPRLGLSIIPMRVVALLATMQFAAYLAIPLMAIFSGHLIQEAHFFLVTAAIQTCLLVALVSRLGPAVIPDVLRHPAMAAALLVFGFCLPAYHVLHRHLLEDTLRPDMVSPPGPEYHRAFTSLARELDRDIYMDDEVIATEDDQFFTYWVGFHGRCSFLAKAWNTVLPDNEIADRVLWFAREERLNAADLKRFIDERHTQSYWLSVDSVSADKMEEWQTRYTQILAKDEKERPRLDLIILSADTKRFNLPDPDPARYVLTYHDNYFRVWKAIKPVQ